MEDTPLVTIQNKSISIKDALKLMEQQSKVHIMYQEDLIDKTKRLDLNLKNVTLRNALDAICIPAKLKYEFVDNYVLITRAQNVTIVPVASDKPIVITGIVLDEKSEPLPGVSVRLKETNEGTICDNNGEFRYVLATTVPSQTLIFSFLGYGKKEVVVKDPSQRLVVSLNPVDAELETVVVTGYGNISKGNYTGAATTVKAEDILLAGVASIDEMLQGIVPGMLVQTVTGQVGASPKIRVRGTSTILGNQEPVWVVDGVIQQDPQPFNVDDNTAFSVSEDDIRRLAGNAISWLNPIDIETITVLKDASATAIYGSKAANGVIVITTKKAYVGKISLQYSGDLTIGQRPNYSLYDRMNSKEIMQFSKEMYEERVSYPSQIVPMGYPGLIERLVNKNISETEFVDAYKKMAGQNTDWFDILFRNSVNQAHTISLSGGSEILQNRTSFGYNEMKGEAIGNDMTTFTASTNTTLVLGSKLTASLQLNGTSREVNGFAYGTAPYDYAYNTTRILPAYNDDGSVVS
ncbi:hypothetical protein AGMMS50239_12280 [Bacteroidia bacterium]|nr:hypothetical protein AGMMS50239_12280 [Bacteroidia bacterium]